MSLRPLVVLLVSVLLLTPGLAGDSSVVKNKTIDATVARMVETYGEEHAPRIRRGVDQVAQRWWAEDGTADEFSEFCAAQFLVDPAEIEAAFARLELLMEQLDGHLHEVRREILSPLHLDTGEVTGLDELFSAVDLATHVDEDLYKAKVAHMALLNFPVHTLDERLADGGNWDRMTWARSRMMDRFSERVPATVAQKISQVFTAADQYIANYNIHMHMLATPKGDRPFTKELRLITHWGLRDELKSQYAEADGLLRQHMILEVMERIVRQEIPEPVINSSEYVWCPENNKVWGVDDEGRAKKKPVSVDREPDTRYTRLLDVFRAVREADRYSPTAPTYIARRFELDRQIPEKQVEALLVSVLASKEFKDTAALIRSRLGRPLEPFDIWYNGFKSRGAHSESELDEIVSGRYPDVAAFQRALPEILVGLGFAPDKAAWLSEHIVVDPSRGAGHAMGASRREDSAHLRTRVGQDGMDYKGYNIAIHELGHNVEQVFSLNAIDHWWLNGVPNTAFTEALAFVFQNRDLELLGLSTPDAESRHMEALDTLWGAAEIGGVALVDMKLWRWMYEHPDATAADLRKATIEVAREVWNSYFAPVFGVKDQVILGIYSHMIVYGLYLPDYPLGHMIAFQVAEALRSGEFGADFARVSKQGRLTPDAWMRGAVGQPVSSRALLTEARTALDAMGSATANN